MDAWKDGWTCRWLGGWTDGWMLRMERGQDRGIDLCAQSSGCRGPAALEAPLWTHPQAIREGCLLNSLCLSKFYCGKSYWMPRSQIPRLAPCKVHGNSQIQAVLLWGSYWNWETSNLVSALLSLSHDPQPRLTLPRDWRPVSQVWIYWKS